MREYRDPITNLLCVTFDNSSVMGEFYQNILNLGSSVIKSIFDSYVDTKIKSYYYNLNIPTNTEDFFYALGGYLQAKINNNTSIQYVFDGKMFLYDSGPFGECVRTNAVKYMTPVTKRSCGLKIVFSNFIIFRKNLKVV